MPDPSPWVGRPGTAQPGRGLNWSVLSSLIRLPNQSGTMLLMLPTLWALVLASHGQPPISLLVIFVFGSFLMRSAGVVINDLADRSFDRQVDRTRMRPLASGALSVAEGLATATVLALMAACLVLFLNQLTILLSPVAFLLAALYPFSKRIIRLPQAALGIAFGWGVVMAWAAVRNSLDAPVWFLYVSTVFWAVAYDTIYALQDRADDARIGVKSSAIFFGAWAWIAVGASVCGMLLLLAVTGSLVGIGPAFYIVLAAVCGFLTHQVWKLRGPVSPALAFTLFRQHVWVGWAILGGIWLGFLKF